MKKKIIRILTVALFTLCIAGFAACRDGGNSKISTLTTPENVYLCHNQTTEDTTEYILTWDKVENADGYEITAFGKTFTTNKNTYDFTSFCEVGKSEKYSVKAISDEKEYADSKTRSVSEKAEAITEGLLYNKLLSGEYTVSRENAEIINGRLVLPDTYNDKKVTETVTAEDDFEEIGITSVRFPKHLKAIGEGTFFKSSLTSIIIPEGVRTIGEYAFGYTTTLKRVVFSKTVTALQEHAFTHCGIEELFIPNNVTHLGADTFGHCEKLKKVIFEEGNKIKEIPNGIFAGCKILSEINIPSGVEKIGQYALFDCDFTEINLPDSLQSIGYSAFGYNKNLTSIYIPKGVTELQDGALWSDESFFVSFTVAEDNPAYKSIDGNVYSKDGTRLIQYATAKTETEFTVPGGVTEIGAYAFAKAQNIAKVTLPQGIKEIGVEAFYWSALKEINIPDGLTTLREKALAVTKLTELIFPDSVTVLEENSIGWLHLERFCMPPHLEIFGEQRGLAVDVFEVSEGAELSSGQFVGTKIKKMIFPKRFEASSGPLFGGFLEAAVIPDVLYKGTEEELLQLIEDGLVAENAFMGADGVLTPDGDQHSATIYFYSENEPPLNEDGTAYDDNYWHYAEDGVTPVIWEK